MLIFNELQMCAKTIKIKTDFQQVRAIDSNKETEERRDRRNDADNNADSDFPFVSFVPFVPFVPFALFISPQKKLSATTII